MRSVILALVVLFVPTLVLAGYPDGNHYKPRRAKVSVTANTTVKSEINHSTRQGSSQQTIDTGNGYWVFCPGGQCPPQSPQAPPQFDFADDEEEIDIEIAESSGFNLNMTLILSVAAGLLAVFAGNTATPSVEEDDDDAASPEDVVA